MNPRVLERSFITGAGLIAALSRVRAQILTFSFSDWYFCRATFKLLHREVLSSKVDAELPELFQLFQGEVHLSYSEETLAYSGCDFGLADILTLLSAYQKGNKTFYRSKICWGAKGEF